LIDLKLKSKQNEKIFQIVALGSEDTMYPGNTFYQHVCFGRIWTRADHLAADCLISYGDGAILSPGHAAGFCMEMGVRRGHCFFAHRSWYKPSHFHTQLHQKPISVAKFQYNADGLFSIHCCWHFVPGEPF
jgi:hypothetical protein